MSSCFGKMHRNLMLFFVGIHGYTCYTVLHDRFSSHCIRLCCRKVKRAIDGGNAPPRRMNLLSAHDDFTIPEPVVPYFLLGVGPTLIYRENVDTLILYPWIMVSRHPN